MLDRADSMPLVSALRKPALVVVGEEDELTPVAESRRMAEAIPNARLEIIPAAGHLANLEQPLRFNTALGTFLTSLS